MEETLRKEVEDLKLKLAWIEKQLTQSEEPEKIKAPEWISIEDDIPGICPIIKLKKGLHQLVYIDNLDTVDCDCYREEGLISTPAFLEKIKYEDLNIGDWFLVFEKDSKMCCKLENGDEIVTVSIGGNIFLNDSFTYSLDEVFRIIG